MGIEDLTENDKKVYEYLRKGDFESQPWSTKKAAEDLGLSEEDVYKAISNIAKYLKDKIWIYYRDGALHIAAE